MRTQVLLVVLGACGGGGSDNPELDVTVGYGEEVIEMQAGNAIPDPDDPSRTIVQLGSVAIDCETDLAAGGFDLPVGTFVHFSVPATPGEHEALVTVTRIDAGGGGADGGTSTISLAEVEPELAGTLDLSLLVTPPGEITAVGRFSVTRCP